MKINGRLIDLQKSEIYPAEICIVDGKIDSVIRVSSSNNFYLLPGLIDSHVHIESSMVTPGAFAMSAVRHGTVGVVSDPHEIANVIGIKGVEYMIEDGKKVPLYFWFGAPSCVPATIFESAGAVLGPDEIENLLSRREVKFLSEMMNFPGVIFDDEEVIEKIGIANRYGKPVDGHAPGLSGENLRKYIRSGISTDHECSTITEAREKISLGMKILIREGSAAKNLDQLKELFNETPEMVMLCTDDIHPEMLEKGHINRLICKLINEGYDIFSVLKSCTVNPVVHYGLESGLLREGDNADFIIVDNPGKMNVIETWIKGVKVFSEGKVNFNYSRGKAVNNFNSSEVNPGQIRVMRMGEQMRVIRATEGELFTEQFIWNCPESDFVESDTKHDILKIVVKDRYKNLPPAVGFIKGFGLKEGAFASSVAHDSHNIICVGADDTAITDCINEIVRIKGGFAVSSIGKTDSFQLNIGGIMSDQSCSTVAHAYEDLSKKVMELGCGLSAPFMTLSFMALLVIPELKISDRGLFNGNSFNLVSLFTG